MSIILIAAIVLAVISVLRLLATAGQAAMVIASRPVNTIEGVKQVPPSAYATLVELINLSTPITRTDLHAHLDRYTEGELTSNLVQLKNLNLVSLVTAGEDVLVCPTDIIIAPHSLPPL